MPALGDNHPLPTLTLQQPPLPVSVHHHHWSYGVAGLSSCWLEPVVGSGDRDSMTRGGALMAKGVDGAKREEWQRRLAKFEASGWTSSSSVGANRFLRPASIIGPSASEDATAQRLACYRESMPAQGLPLGLCGLKKEAAAWKSSSVMRFACGCLPARPRRWRPWFCSQQLQKTQRADAPVTTSRFQRIEFT